MREIALRHMYVKGLLCVCVSVCVCPCGFVVCDLLSVCFLYVDVCLFVCVCVIV